MRANILRATNIVLGLLCLMYFLTYLDRVKISTAMAVDTEAISTRALP